MRKLLYLIWICFGIGSCGGAGDEPIAEPLNTAPSIPILTAPTNGEVCIDNSIPFEWETSIDQEKDPINYQLEIAKDNQFTQIVKSVESNTTSQNIPLEKGVTYYWRVKATDSKKLASKYSSIFNFYTEATAVVNRLPGLPTLIAPGLSIGLSAGTAKLEWSATDSDTNDILTYDVYYGLDNPPTAKVLENKTSTSVEVTTVALKRYYWKVVVKDNKGGQTIGQVWNFKTN
jgi:hypothetical protein